MKHEYLITFAHLTMYNGIVSSVAGIFAKNIKDATRVAESIRPAAGLDIRHVFISNIQRVG